MKKLSIVLLFLLFTTISFAASKSENYYIGDKGHRVFHRPSCKRVSDIKYYNVIIFESEWDAGKKDYNRCSSCRP